MKNHQDKSFNERETLDPVLKIRYDHMHELLPQFSEADWLELKDIALDDSMKELIEFIEQLKRQNLIDPAFPLTVGGLVTTLEKLMSIFKWQRAIIEELKALAIDGCTHGNVAPRKWLGIALSETTKGLSVRRMLPGSPSEIGELRPGDIITKIGTQRVTELKAVKQILDALKPGESLSVTISRAGQEAAIGLTPRLLFAPELDILTGLERDKKCDANCDCKTPSEGALCGKGYYAQGDGPNGGVLYVIRCYAIDDSGFPISSKKCGPFEFF